MGKESRVVKRSKRAIINAYLDVAQEKRLDKITVANILERSELSRGTFYAHFRDVNDVRETIENRFLEIVETPNDLSTPYELMKDVSPVTQQLAEALALNREFVEKVFSQDELSSTISEKIKTLYVEYAMADEKLKSNIDLYRIYATFLAGGVTSALRLWILDYPEMSGKEYADNISKLMTNGTKSIFDSLK